MSIRTTLAFLSLLSLCVSAYADKADDHVAKGNRYVEKDDYKRAFKEYESAVKNDPNNAKAHLLLGLAYAKLGDLNEALKHVENSVRLEPSHSGYHNLGLLYANRSDFEKAADAYGRAVQANPGAFRSWYQLGLVYAAKGEFDKAVGAYRESIKANPRFPEAYLGLGSAAYRAGDKQTAIEQVLRLKTVGSEDKGKALEDWIQNNERKKLGTPVDAATASPLDPPAA